MTYAYLIPGSFSNPASFVANNSLTLGSFNKPVDAKTLVTVDYTQIAPAQLITSYSFRVSPGGEPQLWIDASMLGTPASSLTFDVHGGLGGQVYAVTIVTTLADGEIRSDRLNINVTGADDGYGYAQWSPPLPTDGAVSGDGSVIVNSYPRFFISATPPVGARVLDRWYNTTSGLVSDYISNGVSGAWSITGGRVGGAVNVVKMQPLAPNGLTTTFTLVASDFSVFSITSSSQLFVSVDGVWQEPDVMFTAGGTTLTFMTAPNADSYIFMLWFAPDTGA